MEEDELYEFPYDEMDDEEREWFRSYPNAPSILQQAKRIHNRRRELIQRPITNDVDPRVDTMRMETIKFLTKSKQKVINNKLFIRDITVMDLLDFLPGDMAKKLRTMLEEFQSKG